jgi:5,10-methylenetetrahydromethanopterin reductase
MTTLPRVGIRLHGGIAPRRCMDVAQIAEANGYASVWFAENPFNRGVLPAAAACSVVTGRLRIGIGVFNPFNRHPTLIAMEIGALDELADGRAALGIGAGIGASVERMGYRYDRPIGALRDTFVIVRGLLNGDSVTHEGRVFSANNVKLDYQPLRPDMPLFMAARGDQSLRLCGQIADGLMISNFCNSTFTAHAVDAVQNAARAADRTTPTEIIQYVPCAVRREQEDAYGVVKQALGEMLPGFWSLGQRFASAKAALVSGSNIGEADFAVAVQRLQAGEAASQALDDRFVEAFAIAGTAEQCLQQLNAYAKAGVSEIVLTFAGKCPEEDMADLGRLIPG